MLRKRSVSATKEGAAPPVRARTRARAAGSPGAALPRRCASLLKLPVTSKSDQDMAPIVSDGNSLLKYRPLYDNVTSNEIELLQYDCYNKIVKKWT